MAYIWNMMMHIIYNKMTIVKYNKNVYNNMSVLHTASFTCIIKYVYIIYYTSTHMFLYVSALGLGTFLRRWDPAWKRRTSIGFSPWHLEVGPGILGKSSPGGWAGTARSWWP